MMMAAAASFKPASARLRLVQAAACFTTTTRRRKHVDSRITRTSTTARRTAVILEARRFDRRSFYSLDDLVPPENDDEHSGRPIPPTLDSMLEDEGFGAYDYEPDVYDLQQMIREEQEHQQIMATTGSIMTTDEYALASDEEEMIDPGASSQSILVSEKSSTGMQKKATTIHSEKEKPAEESTFLFEDIEVIPPTHKHAVEEQTTPDLNEFLAKASTGVGATTNLDVLQLQCEDLVKMIYAQNNGNEFNLNSPRQVSQVLYGITGESTKKEVLEAMAGGGNRMADLILQYRSLQQQIKRLTRKQESIQQGTRVRSASTVVRSAKTAGDSALVNDDETTVMEGDPVILVDASNYIFRAYYSMPPIHRADGLPTGATLGFCNMLNRLVLNRMLNGEEPRVILVFDSQGKNFRHDLYSEYKANRQAAPMDLIPQFQLVRQAAKAYGIPQVEAPNYEADDVIATLAQMAQKEGIDTNILSGDKDLMQLVTDKGIEPVVNMIDPGKMERITVHEVMKKWGVRPDKLGDVLALAGDAVDNVPGVSGIGPKTAALLIDEYGSLDELLQNLDNIKQKGRRTKLQNNIEQAKLSRLLVDLDKQVPIESMTFPQGVDQVQDLRMEPFDVDRLLEFYDEMGFRDLKRRVKSRLDGVKRKRSSKNYSRKTKVEVPKPDEYKDVPF